MSVFAVIAEPLSATERAELAAIEIAIEDGLRGIEAMGSRLMFVRDRRLYRETHATFEDYCRERWGMDRTYAFRHIQAAEMAAVLPNGNTPKSEAVARELVPLRDEPERLREAWTEAVEQHGPNPTAAQVREIVRGPEPPPRNDMRFELIEDAVAVLQGLPDAGAIKWPVDEAGDIEMVDESLAWLDAWLPKAKASWKRHKAAMKASG